MGHIARKSDCVACEQKKGVDQPTWTYAQSDQHLCYSFSGQNNTSTCCMQSFLTTKKLRPLYTGKGPNRCLIKKNEHLNCVHIVIMVNLTRKQ